MKTSRNTNEDAHRRAPKKKILKRYMQEKLAVTVIVIMLALLALIGVLYHIIDANNEDYTKLVLTQRSNYDSRTIPYRRGDIVDRNGTYLATSERVYNVIIDASQIFHDENTEKNYLDTTVDALVQCFGYDRAELTETLNSRKTSPYIRYERRISHDKKEAFENLAEEINTANSKTPGDDPNHDKRVYGVWFEEEYKRLYPYNSLACNVIGFASGDGTTGSGGIEQYYNDMLIGNNGREYGYLNDESNKEIVIKPAQNGYKVVSTIDVNVQTMVENRIAQWQAETGSEHIGIIVMDPNNGEILAMADEKKYDLNNPRDLSSRYSEAQLAEMTDEQKVDAMSQMWRNFCVSDTFEPGSPSKILTVAAALEENAISTNSYFYCDGYQHVGGFNIKCTAFSKGGHGELSLTETIMQSCNDAMMQIAALTGKEKFYQYQSMFNLGAKTGIDLPGEASASTLVYRADTTQASALATNAFGQNYNCTMVQMASAFASCINGGYYYEPHVVKQILNESGSVVQKNDGVLVRETVSESTSRFLQNALLMTVEKGTGAAAKVEGYAIGGKTGTAEKVGRNHKDYVVSFCGIAPTDNPKVLVYVVIDQPHVDDQAHSTFASGVFAQVMSDILPYLNVFPSGDVQIVTPIRPSGEYVANPDGSGPTGEAGTETGGNSAGSGNAGGSGTGQSGEDEGTGTSGGENESGTAGEGNGGQTQPEDEDQTGEGTAAGAGHGGSVAGGTITPFPYDTEESVPQEYGEDGSVLPSELPDMLPSGGAGAGE